MKRATEWDKEPDIDYGISIHALVKRATKYITKDNDKIFDFNPRPREEGDFP